ncbi:integrase, partial [Salmonella enterica subsp. enterica serovar Haifa]|nr:integrase [Salmonella enterica subsp. enterica serovar Haifa]
MTFEEACVRWLEEKAHKKSLDDDKSRIGFWLQHFAGMQLKDITETKIYSAIQKMTNRRHEENWKLMDEACRKNGKQPPVFKPKPAA